MTIGHLIFPTENPEGYNNPQRIRFWTYKLLHHVEWPNSLKKCGFLTMSCMCAEGDLWESFLSCYRRAPRD